MFLHASEPHARCPSGPRAPQQIVLIMTEFLLALVFPAAVAISAVLIYAWGQ
jgi:hypothetical protein